MKLDGLFLAITLLVGFAIGFVSGVTSAINDIDRTVQELQERCKDDSHTIHKSEDTK